MTKSLLIFCVSLFACLNAIAAGHVASITVNQNVSCFGLSDGSATASVTGGTGPFSYNWSNSAIGFILNNATAGNYYCIVTDSSDMTVDTAFCTITQPSQINAAAINNGPYCIGATISLTATGGVTYSWVGPNGFTSSNQNPSINNAMPAMSGTYTVTVTVGGCMATATTVVNVYSPIVTTSSTPASCNGACDGTAIASASGGNAPYTYLWMPGGNTTPFLNGACAGTYTITVTDANGCTAVNAATVTQPAPVVAMLSPTAASDCNVCDGSITSSATGGTPGYTYNWSGPNGYASTSPSITNLCSSNYTLSVTDANGCSATTDTTVSNSAISVSVSVAPDTCGSQTGHAIASVSSNQGNVTYSWLPSGATTQAIYGLTAGTYTVTATDTTGCSVTAIATIQSLYSPFLVATSSASSCGASNGTIYANASGGTPPYTFLLNGTPGGSVFSNLSSGTYTVTVSDASGCESSITHFVQNAGLTLTASSTPANCINNTTGSATVTAANGTPPYTYLWSNGLATQTISNLFNGQYSCVVTDAAGCSGTISTYVWQSPSFYIYYGYTYNNCGTNSLTANIYSGTPPFTYSWSPGGQTTQTITNVAPGGYTVTVTDANGCSEMGYFYCYPGNYSILKGSVYADVNSNCVKDGSDYNLNNWYIRAQISNVNYYGNIVNGNYVIYLPTAANTYTLTVTPAWNTNGSYYNASCTPVTTITTSGICDTTVVDFRFDTINAQDLKAYLYCGAARPGFTRSYNISYGNPGTVTMNGTLVMDIDPLLTFTGATPPPSLVSGNHIEWNITNLSPAQWGWINVHATLPSNVPLGTPVHDSLRFDPIAGDILPVNNYGSCSGIVVGSFDPNEKEVYSPQADMNGVIDTAGADLYYTVHFQNTGTDTAFTIVVRDTLSPYVDISTLEMLGASHNYSWSIQPGRCLTVTFNNILLVDSNMNEALSHGFFHYKIHTLPNIAAGNNIDNTAAIYFDFNAPVITNTVTTPVAILTGIVSHNQLNAEVYPNPSNTGSVRVKLNASSYSKISFTMFDAHGRMVRNKNISNAQLFDVDLNDLSEGIYFYKVSNEKGEQSSGKIIVGK